MSKERQLLQVAQDLITQLVGFLSQATMPPHGTIQAALDAANAKANLIRAQADPPAAPPAAPLVAPLVAPQLLLTS